MDSREPRDSSDSGSTPDTSHLNSPAVGGKKSGSKLVIWLVVLVVVVSAGAAGFYFYKTNVLDKKDETVTSTSKSPTPSPSPKTLTYEEQMTATLDQGVAKEMEELKKGDDSTVIKNSTQAAISVGSDLGEEDLDKSEEAKE